MVLLLEGTCDIVIGRELLGQLPGLEELELNGLSLAVEGGAPALTTLTALILINAPDVSIDASLPRLEQLRLCASRVQVAGPGLRLPALTSLYMRLPSDSQCSEVDFGAMLALRALVLEAEDKTSFTGHGISSLSSAMLMRLGTAAGDRVPDGAAALLASAAPGLRQLQLYSDPATCEGELAAAVASLRQLSRLECSRALLPLLPAGTPLQDLFLRCTFHELLEQGYLKLAGLPTLRLVCCLEAPEGEEEQEEAHMEVRWLAFSRRKRCGGNCLHSLHGPDPQQQVWP